jgi:hypothetical protein
MTGQGLEICNHTTSKAITPANAAIMKFERSLARSWRSDTA